MAYIVKRGKFFTAMFRDDEGKQVSRTTKKSDRKEAQKVADAYELAAKGIATQDQIARTITSLHADSDTHEIVTLKEGLARFLRQRAAEVSLSTYVGLKARARSLEEFFAKRNMADRAIGNITFEHLVEFRTWEADRVYVSTANLTVGFVRGFFRWAVDTARILHRSPATALKHVKRGTAMPHVKQKRKEFTKAQVTQLFGLAEGEMKSLILLGVWTGQRLGDIARLKWGDVDFRGLEITICQKKTGTTVGIPLMPELNQHLTMLKTNLKKQPRPEDFILPESEAKLHLNLVGNTRQLSVDFRDLLVKAGIREERNYYQEKKDGVKQNQGDTRSTNEWSFHCLRHTTASMLYQKDVPITAIAAILGHNSVEMTKLYAHENAKRSRPVMLNMEPFITPSNIVPIDASPVPAKDVALQIKAGAERVA